MSSFYHPRAWADPRSGRQLIATPGITPNGAKYNLPTPLQLEKSRIFVVKDGKTTLVSTANRLSHPAERYLPPAGPHYDQYNLEDYFRITHVDVERMCRSCWQRRHGAQGPDCKHTCWACNSKNHLGKPCPAVYAEAGRLRHCRLTLDPKSAVQIRPTLAERAYLVTAGILKSFEAAEEPIVANVDHVAVPEFYKGKPASNLKDLKIKLPTQTESVLEPAVQVAQRDYAMPTPNELKRFTIYMETDLGVRRHIPPLPELKKAMEYFLPPPHSFYYDEYALPKVFREGTFDASINCLSCWQLSHVRKFKDCVGTCTICAKNDHKGKMCSHLYTTVNWWRVRRYNPPSYAQTRPEASEIAYLVLAGVIKEMSRLSDPIEPNMKHPLVKEFYKQHGLPVLMTGRAEDLSSSEESEEEESSEEEVAENHATEDDVSAGNPAHFTAPEAVVSSTEASRAQELHRDARKDSHLYCQEQIAQLREQLSQARNEMAEMTRRIQELERSASETGNKRMRLKGDVGRKGEI